MNKDELQGLIAEPRPSDKDLLVKAGVTEDAVDELLRAWEGLSAGARRHAHDFLNFVAKHWRSRALVNPGHITLRRLGFSEEAEQRLLDAGPYQPPPIQTALSIIRFLRLPIWVHTIGGNTSIDPNKWIMHDIQGKTGTRAVRVWRSTREELPGPFGNDENGMADGSTEAKMDIESPRDAVLRLYHGTSESSAREILTTNIFVGSGFPQDFFMQSAVYWTQNFGQAFEWAAQKWKFFDPWAIIVLEVKAKELKDLKATIYNLDGAGLDPIPNLATLQQCTKHRTRTTTSAWEKHVKLCWGDVTSERLVNELYHDTDVVIGPFSEEKEDHDEESAREPSPKGEQLAFKEDIFHKLMHSKGAEVALVVFGQHDGSTS